MPMYIENDLISSGFAPVQRFRYLPGSLQLPWGLHVRELGHPGVNPFSAEAWTRFGS